MIVFNNLFDVEVPRQILLQINQPDTEGWRKYNMVLVTNKKGDKLVEFEYSFSSFCIERFRGGINDLLEGKIDEFNFEPIEPAFSLKISRLDPDEFEMLCIVDISYIHNGPSTQTGLGVLIVVQNNELKSALEELNK